MLFLNTIGVTRNAVVALTCLFLNAIKNEKPIKLIKLDTVAAQPGFEGSNHFCCMPLVLATVRPSWLLFLCPLHFFLFAFFLCFLPYFNLAVPMLKCSGKHSCTSSTFSPAILNGTCFFRSPGIVLVLVGCAIKINTLIIILPIVQWSVDLRLCCPLPHRTTTGYCCLTAVARGVHC